MSVPGLQPGVADIPAPCFQAPDELIHLRFSASQRRLIHSEAERERERENAVGMIQRQNFFLLSAAAAAGEEEEEEVKV